MTKITDFDIKNHDNEPIDADPFGNNVAFQCFGFDCNYPVLAVALKNQRGGSSKNPAICRGCERKYRIDVCQSSKTVTIEQIP